MTLVTHTLYHPRRPDGSTGSAFAIHFTPQGPDGEQVEVVNHCIGGMGAWFPIKAARAYYKQKLKEGYTT